MINLYVIYLFSILFVFCSLIVYFKVIFIGILFLPFIKSIILTEFSDLNSNFLFYLNSFRNWYDFIVNIEPNTCVSCSADLTNSVDYSVNFISSPINKIFEVSIQSFTVFPEYFLGISTIYLFVVISLITYNNYGLILQKALSKCLGLTLVLACYLILNDDINLGVVSFYNSINNDFFGHFTKLFVCFFSALYLFFISNSLKKQGLISFEFLIIILFAVIGLMLLCMSQDLLTTYLAIELSSLSFYILASFKKTSTYSIEAGVKYFILGAISSALFLLGTSLIYLYSGSLNVLDFSVLFKRYVVFTTTGPLENLIEPSDLSSCLVMENGESVRLWYIKQTAPYNSYDLFLESFKHSSAKDLQSILNLTAKELEVLLAQPVKDYFSKSPTGEIYANILENQQLYDSYYELLLKLKQYPAGCTDLIKRFESIVNKLDEVILKETTELENYIEFKTSQRWNTAFGYELHQIERELVVPYRFSKMTGNFFLQNLAWDEFFTGSPIFSHDKTLNHLFYIEAYNKNNNKAIVDFIIFIYKGLAKKLALNNFFSDEHLLSSYKLSYKVLLEAEKKPSCSIVNILKYAVKNFEDQLKKESLFNLEMAALKNYINFKSNKINSDIRLYNSFYEFLLKVKQYPTADCTDLIKRFESIVNELDEIILKEKAELENYIEFKTAPLWNIDFLRLYVNQINCIKTNEENVISLFSLFKESILKIFKRDIAKLSAINSGIALSQNNIAEELWNFIMEVQGERSITKLAQQSLNDWFHFYKGFLGHHLGYISFRHQVLLLKDYILYKFNFSFLKCGISLIFFSLFIKLALAPFHSWSLDVYEGSPTISSFFFAVITKFSIFVVLIRLYFEAFYFEFSCIMEFYCILIGIFSIFVGSFGGLKEKKIKTLLAYSSVSNMGYFLLVLSAGNFTSISILFFYLILYVISGLCTWFIIINLQLKKNIIKLKYNKELADFALLRKSNPAFALALSLTLFSMAGIPPLVGFLGKIIIILSLFISANNPLLLWAFLELKIYTVVILSVFCSVISTFYYIRIIKVLYFENTLVGKLYYPVNTNNTVILSLLLFMLIFLLINPSFLLLYLHKITILSFHSF